MAISHLCLQCGFDMARVRARLDPRYDLPLVMCPTCGTAAVRRRHPLVDLYRSLLRVDAALTALLLQVLAAIVFCGAIAGSAIGLGELLVVEWIDDETIRAGVAALISLGLIVPIAAGAWLTGSLAHWRPIPLWLTWAALTAVLVTIITFAMAWQFHEDDAWRAARTGTPFDMTTAQALDTYFLGRWLRSLGALAALLVVSTAGVPVGQLGRWLWRRMRRHRWSWRRRGRRKMLAG